MRKMIAALQLAALAVASAAGAQPEAAPTPAAPAEAAAPVAAPPAEPAPAAAPAAVLFTARPQPPPFVFMAAGNAAFALVGALAAVSASKKLVTDNELEDPAKGIVGDLAKAYAQAQGLSFSETPVVIESTDPKVALEAARARGARYVVDVVTQAWTVIYFPTDWTHYGVMYGAQLQVLDLSTGAVVTKGRCFIKPVKTPQSPDHDTLMANKAERLKAITADVVQQCAAKLRTDTLKLPAAPVTTAAL